MRKLARERIKGEGERVVRKITTSTGKMLPNSPNRKKWKKDAE
jgi:hypothetical protein